MLTRPRLLATLLTAGAVGLAAVGCSDDNNSSSAGADTGVSANDENQCESIDLAADAPDEPVTIRLGHGAAAEEQVWLMEANPDVGQHDGVWYDLEMTQFGGNEERFVAYQAGELDAVTSSAPTLVSAVSSGQDVSAVASVSREAAEGEFRTTFVALEGSGIEGPEDLQGKTIGIVDIGSATDYWAKTAVASAGLDFETDAEYVVLPFPAQEEALRNGQIDVAVLVEPFYTMAMDRGGLVEVFDALTGPGFDQELITLAFDNTFREENPGVVCAFLADFQASTGWYLDNEDEAKQILVDEGYVSTPIEVYREAGDWLRDPDATIDVDLLGDLIDSMIEYGVLQEDQRVPADQLVAGDTAPTGSAASAASTTPES
jgi:ABC-type nitrate/sulfonate/bicarbonate transport system substrate-binding protein